MKACLPILNCQLTTLNMKEYNYSIKRTEVCRITGGCFIQDIKYKIC